MKAHSLPALLACLSLCASLACGGRSPCSTARCPDSTVCDLDGSCRALPDPAQAATFTEADALYPVGWNNPSRDLRVRTGSDQLLLGGDGSARVDLVFELPTYRRSVAQAVLVLFAHPHAGTTPRPATLSVSRVRGGEALNPRRRTPLLPIGGTQSARVEQLGVGQAIRLDVSEAARATTGGQLGLRVRMVRGGGGAPWRLASPDTLDPAQRPRLELLLR